jgi:hypothetical protein
MAILDGLKNAVAANVARSANNIAVNGLRNIVGDVFGVDLNPTNPAAKLENRTTKFSTEMLQYPAGVEVDDQQGHYIIFEILTQTKSKLKSTKGNARIAELQRKLDEDFPDKSPQRDRAVKALQEATTEHKIKQAASKYANTSHQSLQMSKMGKPTIATMIALYMPPSISVSYNSKYGEQEISALAGAASGAIDAFTGRSGATMETAIKGALGEGKQALETGLMKVIDTVAPGATALLALEKGAIRTPRMELMFEGIGRREFAFEFVFIPKSKDEAEDIQKIVHRFKFHMASNYTDGTFREMDIPSLFNIRYMYRSAENRFLNKISTCALESLDVSYGGDRFVAYEGGVPQTTKISLKFKEMEIITKDHIGGDGKHIADARGTGGGRGGGF